MRHLVCTCIYFKMTEAHKIWLQIVHGTICNKIIQNQLNITFIHYSSHTLHRSQWIIKSPMIMAQCNFHHLENIKLISNMFVVILCYITTWTVLARFSLLFWKENWQKYLFDVPVFINELTTMQYWYLGLFPIYDFVSILWQS